jgi:hypothetical protein
MRRPPPDHHQQTLSLRIAQQLDRCKSIHMSKTGMCCSRRGVWNDSGGLGGVCRASGMAYS